MFPKGCLQQHLVPYPAAHGAYDQRMPPSFTVGFEQAKRQSGLKRTQTPRTIR
jgi:hypothetical protein